MSRYLQKKFLFLESINLKLQSDSQVKVKKQNSSPHQPDNMPLNVTVQMCGATYCIGAEKEFALPGNSLLHQIMKT